MSRTNEPPVIERPLTHEGALGFQHLTPEQSLRRSVLSCMLWEGEFYEEGASIAKRIDAAAQVVPVSVLADLTVEARTKFNLRHVPLLLLSVLARRGSGSNIVSETIAATIQRADELAEFLAVYAKYNDVAPGAVKKKLSAQVKKGLAKAFGRFDEYQLAKYDRANAIRLRDALFLCHAKPENDEQAALWKRLIDGNLATPETWEVKLSGGADKKETFEGLIRDGKLGYLALLRNLRNMTESGCDLALVRQALIDRKGAHRVLPFRFIAAARHAPKFADAIDESMLATLREQPKLSGKTVVVIDVSGSMQSQLSGKSEMSRMDAACALGAIARELCEEASIYATAGNDGTRIHKTAAVPNRHGMALVDATAAMCAPLGGGGIFLKQTMDFILKNEKEADRIIVITDEQDCGVGTADSPQNANAFGKENYLINVASYKTGIGYGPWTHIDGFSENVFSFIRESSSLQ